MKYVLLFELFYFSGEGMLVPVIPLYLREMHAPTELVGATVAANAFTAAALAMPLGIISDRLGRKIALLFASVVVSASSLLLFFASAPLPVLLAWALAGVGSAALRPSITALVGEMSPSDRLGASYGLYSTVEAIEMSFAPTLGGTLVAAVGYQSTFLASSGIVAVGAILGVMLIPNTPRRRDKTPSSLEAKSAWTSLYRQPVLLTSSLIIFFFNAITGVVNAFLPLYAADAGLGPLEIGLVFSTFQIANMMGRLPFGSLSDVVNRSLFVTIGMAFAAASVAVMPQSRLFAAMSASMFGLGLARAMLYPTSRALVASAIPGHSLGSAMGLFNTFASMGRTVSPPLIGVLIATLGFQMGFAAVGALGFLGTILIQLPRRRRTTREPPSSQRTNAS